MSDTSDRSSADPFTLVLRAAFVPDGEQPPAEFIADLIPLKFRASLDPASGTITCDNTGMSLDGDIRAEWHLDEGPQAAGEATADHADDTRRTVRTGGPGRVGQADEPETASDRRKPGHRAV